MIGVTIGIGSEWNSAARTASDRMAEYTGLKCHIIDSWHGNRFEHPVWMKHKILELFPHEESFLYFDADVWALQPWSPSAMFIIGGGKFMIVPVPAHSAITAECERFDIPLGRYMNAGLFMFHRGHQLVFDYTLSQHPECGRWFDQTPLNIALVKTKTEIFELPQKYNAECHQGKYNANHVGVSLEEVVNLHWCSCNQAQQVRELQNQNGGRP